MQAGRLDPAALHAALAGLETLAPNLAISAGQQLRNLLGFPGLEPGILLDGRVPLADIVRFGAERREEKRRNLLQKLRDASDLAWLVLFHADGRWRELALDRITEPPRSMFRFIAITLRPNYWVGQVRAAAVACARRLFPATNPAVIADAAPELLLRRRKWSR